MLLIFMLSLGTHIFNSEWLTHDLNAEQGRNTLGMLADEHQAKYAEQGQFNDWGSASGSLSNAEHKLLHSADPAQPLLLTYIPDGLHDLSPRTIPVPAPVATLSPAEPEPPFRPPRTAYRG